MRRTFLSLFVLSWLTLPLQAQLPLGFGLKGGARLTDFTETASNVTSEDHVYTIGPYGELHLPVGFSLEVDLLYKRSGSTLYNLIAGQPTYKAFTMSSWDVPILLKKTFKTEMIFRPFVVGGLASRYSSGIPGSTTVVAPVNLPGSPIYTTTTTSGWHEGLALGFGGQFKILVLKCSGELRWSYFGNISSHTLPKLNANQVELLLGVGL